MAIHYDPKNGTITLNTPNTSYQMLIGSYGFLFHLYYGRRICCDMRYLLDFQDHGFSGNPYEAGADRTFSADTQPLEYPTYGNGDFRSCALELKKEDGTFGLDLRYAAHRILKGKYSLPGLPSVYADEDQAETLELVLKDEAVPVAVTLRYGVLSDSDVITRSVQITNTGDGKLFITKAASASLDLAGGRYDFLHFYGKHGQERSVEREEILHDRKVIGSRRGTSSHQHNPFHILARHQTTEEAGSCYGMMLLYSGSFSSSAEKDPFGMVRTMTGIQDELFSWMLAPGESFYTPEAVLTYSADGFTGLSKISHRLIRNHIVRGKYKLAERPIVINSWEAALFDFDGQKIVDIARQASALGMEMMVLDDGWFGKRDSDNAGLGDWTVNEEKLGGPLSAVSDRIHALGMKFGLWIEPEMVNEDSDLYRAHPDWAFTIPSRKPVRGRNQLVLDFSRKEVVDHVFGQIAKVLDETRIEYLKMDMNRSLCDVYSAKYADDPDRQNCGRIMHEYVLGVYDFLERLIQRYPALLIEGCSGGGGRYDAGMMYYTPQIWLSDNTDAMERLGIQYGSSFAYPVSTVGSHVSACPNQQTGRSVPLHTRAVVAMSGNFGYELDPLRLSEADQMEIRREIADFRKYRPLIHNGIYYRLTEQSREREAAAWSFVSETQDEMLLNMVSLNTHCNPERLLILCRGLDGDSLYREETTGKLYSGNALMEAGFPVPVVPGEYRAWQYHFIKEETL